MTKLAWASLAWLAVFISRDAWPAAASQATFRASTHVISVNVSVKRGEKFVQGLPASDFVLQDNGIVQAVELVSTEILPVDLTLVLTGEPPFDKALADQNRRSQNVADAARRLLMSKDRLRVVAIRADVAGGFVSADAPLAPLLGRAESPGGIALTDGLYYALALPVAPGRRHIVLAFTDGWDTWSTLEPEILVPLAERSDAVLSAVIWNAPGTGSSSGGGIGISGAPRPQRERERSFRTLGTAVAASGGSMLSMNDAPEALRILLEEFRQSYLLQYSPRGVSLPGWHTISVSVRQPGKTVVKARKGYFVEAVR